MKILQPIVSPAEHTAKELAELWVSDGQKAASKRFKEIADGKKLTLGEIAAIANITTCILHEKEWKI